MLDKIMKRLPYSIFLFLFRKLLQLQFLTSVQSLNSKWCINPSLRLALMVLLITSAPPPI